MGLRYKQWNVALKHGFYDNGRDALQLIDADDGETVATATTNLPDEPLADGEAFVKDYSENKGMLDWLLKNGLAVATGRSVKSGFVSIPVVKLKGGSQ